MIWKEPSFHMNSNEFESFSRTFNKIHWKSISNMIFNSTKCAFNSVRQKAWFVVLRCCFMIASKIQVFWACKINEIIANTEISNEAKRKERKNDQNSNIKNKNIHIRFNFIFMCVCVCWYFFSHCKFLS